MKKHNILYAILISTAMMLSACQEEIEFNSEEQAPQLVMYCLATEGKPLNVSISNTLFFLAADRGAKEFIAHIDQKNGSVKIYVNGSSTPLEAVPETFEDDILQRMVTYSCDYIPKSGDRIHVVASFPGLGESSGETVVPKAEGLEIKKVTVSDLGENHYRIYVTATISDAGTMPLYYGLFPEMTFYGSETYTDYLDLTSCDLIVNSSTDEIFNLIDNGNDAYRYFSGNSFKGKSRTFGFSFDIYGDRYNNYGQEPEWSIDKCEFNVNVDTISEDLYMHILSKDAAADELNEYLGEPGSLHSNTTGGWGVVCSSASTNVKIK